MQFEVCQTQSSRKSHSSSVIKFLLCPPCLLATTADSILPCFTCCLEKEELSRNNGAWSAPGGVAGHFLRPSLCVTLSEPGDTPGAHLAFVCLLQPLPQADEAALLHGGQVPQIYTVKNIQVEFASLASQLGRGNSKGQKAEKLLVPQPFSFGLNKKPWCIDVQLAAPLDHVDGLILTLVLVYCVTGYKHGDQRAQLSITPFTIHTYV
ncbi:hypothetical protein EK904_007153 [Melospiza melodia maxima]|nr:hypothetical protein EK904_007153 [Melospiza melodia maxima]